VRVDWVEPDWPAPGGVRALSTVRSGGVSLVPYASLNLGDHVGDMPTAVAENRRRLVVEAGLPAEPVWLAQVHGITVADLDARMSLDATGEAASVAAGSQSAGGVTSAAAASLVAASVAGTTPIAGAAFTADAAFTRQPGMVCAILTADCLPVLLADESGGVVAAAHAGWRGLVGGVIEATVGAMGERPGALMAWLGPAIGPEHFEVGAEVREAMLQEDPGAEGAFVLNERGRFMADLEALARRRLATLGVNRIYGGGRCTHADAERYFSHRRDGVTGRQATLIWLDRAPK
jgi:polyphenol oxidase